MKIFYCSKTKFQYNVSLQEWNKGRNKEAKADNTPYYYKFMYQLLIGLNKHKIRQTRGLTDRQTDR